MSGQAWPIGIFRALPTDSGEGNLGLLGGVKVQSLHSSFSKDRFPSARRTALSVETLGLPYVGDQGWDAVGGMLSVVAALGSTASSGGQGARVPGCLSDGPRNFVAL